MIIHRFWEPSRPPPTCISLGAGLGEQQAPRQAQERVVAVVRRCATLQLRGQTAVCHQLACAGFGSVWLLGQEG